MGLATWDLPRPTLGFRVTPAPTEDRQYRPDLDGLRAVAVVLVILTHAHLPWTNNGGDAGVTAFFVLSGFLITNILRREIQATGTVDVRAFYRRRVQRLAPALLGLLVFTAAFGVTIGWPFDWQLGIASCLLYVSNWLAVADVNINPLGHTWSLAIEEQFYLVWPAVLILARRRIVPVILAGIVVGTVLRLIAGGTFEYFATPTRFDALLVGCLLAVIGSRWSSTVGFAGFALLVLVAFAPLSHDLAITVAMVATLLMIGGRVRFLEPLAPVGLRAYSLYLWNWPATLLFGPGIVAPLVTVAVAEISYRLLEKPFLRRRASTPAMSEPEVSQPSLSAA
jgi:peptidoglycan/LPS O-acetylase OafA/YrhL